MENQQNQVHDIEVKKPWYKKKRYIIPLGTLGLVTALSSGSSEPTPVIQVDTTSSQVQPLETLRVEQKEEKKVETVKNTVPEKLCNSNYSGCLNPNASDYDCAGGSGNGPYYTGRVQVLGYDEYDLDRDSDGWGCE